MLERHHHLLALLLGIAALALTVGIAYRFPTSTVVVERSGAPYLVDLSGRYRLGGPTTPYGRALVAAGATSIVYSTRTGYVAGAYVDDDQPGGEPEEIAYVRAVRLLHPRILVVGLAASYHLIRIRGITNAYEFYPYGTDLPISDWLPLPRTRAFILQRRFAFPGASPPTYRQFLRIERIARRAGGRLLWAY